MAREALPVGLSHSSKPLPHLTPFKAVPGDDSRWEWGRGTQESPGFSKSNSGAGMSLPQAHEAQGPQMPGL